MHYANNDALVFFTRPKSETPVGLRASNSGIEFPKQPSGHGVQSENFLRRRNSVEYAIDDDWAGLETARFLRVKGPGLLQARDIRAVDLCEGRIVSVARRSTIHGPILGRRVLNLRRARGKKRRNRERTTGRDAPEGQSSKFHGASLAWKRRGDKRSLRGLQRV